MVARAVFFAFCFTYINAYVWDLNCNQIRQFVDGHNSMRLQVAKGQVPNQPPAVTMNSMVWDEELARKAANWAAQNRFEHNPDRNIPSNRFRTGENLYRSKSTAKDTKFTIDRAMEVWFVEHKNFRYKALTPADFTGKIGVGHYTQMIWADSMYLGCAVSEVKDGYYYRFLVVCNYGPPGNILTMPPYESGKGRDVLTCGAQTCSRPYGSQCSSGLRGRARALARAQTRARAQARVRAHARARTQARARAQTRAQNRNRI